MTIAQPPIFNEVYDFLLSAPTPEQVIAFRPSEATQERVRHLLARSRDGSITEDERAELDAFEQVEHFVRMLKIRAHQKVLGNL